MIRLLPFTSDDFSRLLGWIRDEESMVQFAGSVFSWPLTHDQLTLYVQDPFRQVFKVVNDETVIGHAEITRMDDKTVRLCRILIGEKGDRGKGHGRAITDELIHHALLKMRAESIELNVFDFNTAAIHCYEKAGFVLNPSKMKEVNFQGKTWRALNMVYQGPYAVNRVNWDKVADKYHEVFGKDKVYDESYRRFLERLSDPGARILDVGCGPATVTKRLLHFSPGLRVSGMDVSPAMVEKAREVCPNADFFCLDIRELNTLKEKFRGVIAGFCLPYISPEDVPVFFTRVHRLLEKDGIFYLSAIVGNPAQSGIKYGSHPGVGMFVHYFEPAFLLRELDRAGFSLLDEMRLIDEERSQNYVIFILRRVQ